MKIVVTFLVALVLPCAASAQIKGCTSDVRTGVCNKDCSVTHTAGCTKEQLDPRLRIDSSKCLSDRLSSPDDPFHGDMDKRIASCKARLKQQLADWKAAHRGKRK
jgi:hypothetical protein